MADVKYNDSRLGNVDNHHQRMDRYPRTLCVCSGGLLRSPTLAWVLSNPPYNRNTRAAGSHPAYALVDIDEVLLAWADEIVFVNQENEREVQKNFHGTRFDGKVYTLDIPDRYQYRDPELVKAIIASLINAGFPEGSR